MDDQVLEAIAEQVHDAWAAEKQRQGFADHVWPTCDCRGAHGQPHAVATHPVDDDCAIPQDKHHTDMLPYAQLPEHIKEYDRVTARAALGGIERAGYRLVKAKAAP